MTDMQQAILVAAFTTLAVISLVTPPLMEDRRRRRRAASQPFPKGTRVRVQARHLYVAHLEGEVGTSLGHRDGFVRVKLDNVPESHNFVDDSHPFLPAELVKVETYHPNARCDREAYRDRA